MTAHKVQKVDVAIIGADANLVIIDSDNTVGGVWSKDRIYPNLVAQVRLGLFNYSDTPMPPNGGDPKDPRVTGEMIHNYLQKYAEDHDLLRRIRFNTFVKEAKKLPNGWRLTLRECQDIIETEKLLVATGVTSIPYMPDLERAPDSVPIIHSRDLGMSWNALGDDSIENVIVTGAAKSAYDAVYLLLNMGKKVTWVIREDGGGPLSILPFRVLNMGDSTGFSKEPRRADGAWGDSGISWITVFWAHSGLGVVTLPDFWTTLHKRGLNIVRGEVRSTQERSVTLKTGEVLDADYLVMCTGWGDHFAIFDEKHKADIGLPGYHGQISPDTSEKGFDWRRYDIEADRIVDEMLPFLAKPPTLKYPKPLDPSLQQKWRLYRRSIPVSLAGKGDRSLAILGQIHTIQTPLVSEVQSLWTILYLLGEIDLPDTDEMAKEVALWNAWTRKRYLNQGQKFPYSLYDFLPPQEV
ncbi:hypothetical protein DL770_003807 [Monosporascus sp. CRB-9-2]|nr:hypothetical protein DL770_003807 [Monosporascus sp. CRB-9-2]